MELEFHEAAFGPCVICGKDSTGSLYWLPMTREQWALVRPYVATMFKPDMVQDVLFIPQLCQPFCSTACVAKHYSGVANESLKHGG